MFGRRHGFERGAEAVDAAAGEATAVLLTLQSSPVPECSVIAPLLIVGFTPVTAPLSYDGLVDGRHAGWRRRRRR